MNYLKQKLIKVLTEDIQELSASDLELVGHAFVNSKEDNNLIHRGLNVDNRPVGYTLDSFSQNRGVVAEYSTDKDYFKDTSAKDNPPKFTKVFHDIDHTLQHVGSDNLTKLYLVSSQLEPASFRKKLGHTDKFKEVRKKLIILSAKELAEGIYKECLESTNAVDIYRNYFPTFLMEFTNFGFFGKLPTPCNGYARDDNSLAQIEVHLSLYNVCVLSGMSGSGKTQLVIDYIHKTSESYQNYIWISGAEWPKDTSLQSIQSHRGGSPVNIVGQFSSRRSILVLDSYKYLLQENTFTELEKGFNLGGKIIVTTQLSNPHNQLYLSIPEISSETALNILGEDQEACTNKCAEFVRKCRFSPLILSIIKNISDTDGVPKEELFKEILNNPESVDGHDGLSIIKVLLNRLGDKELISLKKIANSSIYTHEINFLRSYLGVMATRKLQKLSILIPDNSPSLFRIHDLIALSIQDNDPLASNDLIKKLEEYIENSQGDMTPSVISEIHLCLPKLIEENELRGEREIDWLHYALLQSTDPVRLEISKKFYNLEIDKSIELVKIKTIIDSKESYVYGELEKPQREEFYRECASQYEIAFSQPHTEEVQLELLHHKGKAYRRFRDYPSALDSFKQLLERRPEWHATYGQIAHIGSQYNVGQKFIDEGLKALNKLLDDIFENSSKVPLRVSLAAISRLRSKSYHSLKLEITDDPEKVLKISEIIQMSSLEGLGQFFEAYIAFTSMFGLRYAEICVDLAESIPSILTSLPETTSRYQWVNACESLADTSEAAKNINGKKKFSKQLIDVSLIFADAINDNDSYLNPYETRATAKVFNLAKQSDKALEVIDKLSKGVNHWVLYEKASALLEKGEYVNALTTALECLDMAEKDPNGNRYICSYFDQISECYKGCDDNKNSKVYLEKALEICSDKKLLQSRLDDLQAQKRDATL